MARNGRAIAMHEYAFAYFPLAKAQGLRAIVEPGRAIAVYRKAIALHLFLIAKSHHAMTEPDRAFKQQDKSIMRQVKADLRGLNAIDVLARARTTLEAMKGNPFFPNPIPTMVDFEAACDALDASNVETLNGGNRLAFTIKRERMDLVRDMMKTLAAYVSAVARGNAEIVVSAAFEQRRPSVRITSLDAPQDVRAHTGELPGTIHVRWRPLRGARIYRVYIKRGGILDDGAWELLTLTSNSRYTATGLDALKYYSFRIEAIGASAISPLSQAVTALSVGEVE